MSKLEVIGIIVGIITGIVSAVAAVLALRGVFKRRGDQGAPEKPAAPLPSSDATFPAGLIHNLTLQHKQRNLMFTGRKKIMEDLAAALDPCRPAALTQAVSGGGGVGKTAIALEYVHRSIEKYEVIWWLRAEHSSSLRDDLAALARTLGLVREDEKDDQAIAAAERWLADSDRRWLLVFDNAPGPEALREFIPAVCKGHVIITSRQRNCWSDLAAEQAVDVMTLDDAVEFLVAYSGCDDPDGAAQVAEALGRLPLALEQARAYIRKRGCGFGDYLEKFNRHGTKLFTAFKPGDYDQTVATTHDISIEAVENSTHAGGELLKLLCFCGPDDLPIEVIKNGAQFLPPPLSEDIAEGDQFDLDLMALNDYSLIKLERNRASIHRLLQHVVRAKLHEGERKKWAEAAVRMVDKAFPGDSDDVRTWPTIAPLIDHALAASHYAENLRTALEQAARLLNEVGVYFNSKARFAEAEPLMRRVVEIIEMALGPEHPNVAAGLNNLAQLLQATNRLSEAEPLMRRALAIDEASFGPEHPRVAIDLNNLASLLQATNRLSEAEPMKRRALAIDEASFGLEHPNVAIRLNNLATLLQATNRLAEAEPLMRRALAIDEASFGPEHPEVATDLNNLAQLLNATNRLSEAEPLMRRALAIDEASFGPEHPEVAIRLNNLAQLLQDTNRLSEAEPLMRRALAIDEASFGTEHPNVAIRLNNLAGLMKATNRLADALPLYQRAAGIMERSYGEGHPSTVTVRGNLRAVEEELEKKGRD